MDRTPSTQLLQPRPRLFSGIALLAWEHSERPLQDDWQSGGYQDVVGMMDKSTARSSGLVSRLAPKDVEIVRLASCSGIRLSHKPGLTCSIPGLAPLKYRCACLHSGRLLRHGGQEFKDY